MDHPWCAPNSLHQRDLMLGRCRTLQVLMRIGRLSRGSILVRSDSRREDGTAKEHRPTLSHSIYLLTGVILVTVIVFPSVATSPINWTFAPAFAASAAKF